MAYSCKTSFGYRGRSYADHNPPLKYRTRKFYQNKKDTSEKIQISPQVDLILEAPLDYGPHLQLGL